MKDKPIAIIITLTAGLIACICCILNNAGLLATLITVFISLLVFLIIGLIVNSIITKQTKKAEEREKEERQRLEDQAAEGKKNAEQVTEESSSV